MNWETLRADEYCIAVKDGTHDTPKPVDFGYKLVTGKHVKNGQIDSSSAYYISEEDYNAINKRSMVERWDVIMSMIGTVGEAAVVKNDPDYAIKNVALFKCGGSEVRGKWLCYYLNSPEGKGKMLGEMKGSSQQFLSLKQLRELPIMFSEEKVPRIVEIISNYDDLIENNQKQIKLLEEAAQRLYKEWFVDLRFPGHENTKIVDGVPEGWQYEKLGDLVKTTSGGTPSRRKSEYYVNGNIRWIKTKELNDRFIFETEEHITEDAVKNSSAKVLPEGALIVAMYGATIGKIGITAAEMACNQACCAFISFDDMISKEYLYCWLMDNREYLVSQGKGAAQSNLSQEMIRNFSLLCPDKKVIKNFTEIVTTMLENKRVLENKILMLSKARDDLLPKLMSGEVEV